MSFPWRSVRNVLSWSVVGLLAIGCRTPSSAPSDEEENVEAEAARTEMLQHRARIEPKTGFMIPVNNRFDVSDPTDGVAGIKGSFEAFKFIWFGAEFDYAKYNSKDPAQPGTPNPQTLSAEQMMDNVDRYEILLSADYDIELPLFKDPTYNPILRPGIGMGFVVFNIHEAPGNTLFSFNKYYQFVGRPTLALRFPFHKNIAAFVEGNYDYIPQSKMQGQFIGTSGTQTFGNEVQFSSGNIWLGLSFEW